MGMLSKLFHNADADKVQRVRYVDKKTIRALTYIAEELNEY